MNNVEFKSTFDEIEFDIAMKMYMEHNSKIASINEHLGEMYSYKDLEEAKALEEYDTLQEYRKALKEKCDAIDKAIEYIEENFYEVGDCISGSDMPYQPIQDLLDILRGNNEKSNE